MSREAGSTVASDPGRPIRVGFLHVGREHSGVRRYGSLLAAGAAARPDLEVIESDAGGRDTPWRGLRDAAARLGDADIVHVQWKLADWDPRFGGIPRMEVALRSLPRPVVLTLHDVFERSGLRERWLSLAALGLRRIGSAAARLVVHAEEERRRLAGMVARERVAVVPHFVEARRDLPDRDAARDRLGLSDRRVITLLGYMTRRRGHGLVLDALAHLPPNVEALFVGSVIEGRDHVEASLRQHAADIGVAERVRFLGYVSDERLDDVLAATDVALCPFREMSASGALATWLSANRPIVASDLPAIRELEAMQPGALQVFSPYAAGALAERIGEVLARSDGRPDADVAALAARLSMPRTMDRYVDIYREALGRHETEAGSDRPSGSTGR